MKKFLLLLLFVGLFTATNAQNFAYKVDFGFRVDNLEHSDPWSSTRTLLSVKLAPQVGVIFDKHHSLMVGGDLIQDLGDSTFISQAKLMAYYKYGSRNFNAYAGMFPRRYSIAEYPRLFFRSEIDFYKPVVQGAMLQYINNKKTGFVELYADWYGQNQELRIDEFMVNGASEYNFFDKLLIAGANAQISHYKNDYVLKDAYLFERLYYNVYVGTDLVSLVPVLSKARVTFGTLSSNERKRVLDTETSWEHNYGWNLDANVEWKGLGLRNRYYFGDKQQNYMSQYGGSKVYWGTSFYNANHYNRTDLYYSYRNKKGFFYVRADIVLHCMDGVMANQQLLTLGINLSQKIEKKRAVNY